MIRVKQMNSGENAIEIEGIEKSFVILTAALAHDLYFQLDKYDEGHIITIPESDTEAYNTLMDLFSKIKKVDDKYSPLFKDGVFEWICDAGLKEESNKIRVYQKDNNLVFDFWRNELKPYSYCFVGFATSGAINQDVVNELMRFYNKTVYGTGGKTR